MNETIELINRRVSLRRYAQRPVSPEDEEVIVGSALRAPTARNMMLYSIIKVTDPEVKSTLGKTCNHAWIGDTPLVLLFGADMQRTYDFYRVHGMEDACGEKCEAYVLPDMSNLMMSCCDALIAAQNAVIAAESLGIGSCYVGDIMGRYETHRELFDLPRWFFPITLLCLGYYPEGYERHCAQRFDREYVCFADTYRHLNEKDFAKMFSRMDEWFAKMQREYGFNPGEALYRTFSLGEPEIEEMRSVRLAVDRWLKGEWE